MTITASWYHCSVKPVSRSAGRSAVAAAAYRTGEKLHDDRTQLTHDYTRRQGVEASFIIAPEHAPDWASDVQKLWNAAEAAEKRSNSQTAREIVLALPSGVGAEGREQIARDFAAHLVERYGVAATVALHEPSKGGDDRNHHAHILLTTRRMEADGLGNKTRELDDLKTGRLEVRHIRETAADLINAALENAGSDERVDHRSNQDRGLEQVPTERLSLEEIAQEKKGKHSKTGDRNRKIKEINETITALVEEREELDRQILEIGEQEAPTATGPNPEPTEASGNYWQDRLNAERQGDNEGGTPPAVPPTIEAQETITAQSAFDDPATLAHAEQIREQGEIKHKGLAVSWVEHVGEIMEKLRDGLLEKWREFIQDREPPTHER
jgi:hypothetical protein